MEIYGVELEVWIAAGAAILALGVWGLKRYQTVMATEEAHDKFVEAKKRKCSLCGVSGHDKRNCPTHEDE